jgi:tRNA-modifying protein YgfZ
MTTVFEPLSGRLPHLGILRFTGPDSLSFLQGQVSNDTGRLRSGNPLLAAYSNPQGRVLAVMHLLPHSSGVAAILPRELVAPTLERLRKFVLRAKVQMEDPGESLQVSGQHGVEALHRAQITVPHAEPGYVESAGVGVAAVRPGAERYWVIAPGEQLIRHQLAGDTGAGDIRTGERIEQAWRLADIRDGLPQVYSSTHEAFVAQMLNLDLLDGISFSKGCYTGQEIIARTQHLGRIKRRMYRLHLPEGDWSTGQSLRLVDGRSGRLVEVARAGDGFEALAVLNLRTDTGANDPTPSGDSDSAPGAAIAAAELPLPYAL